MQVVSAPAEAPRDVELPAFESFRVHPGSQVRLLSAGELEVELMQGGLQFAARADRPAFVLIAAPYAFRVLGGAAKVSRVGDRLSVRVTRGRVELLGPGAPSEITVGSSVWLEAPDSRGEASARDTEKAEARPVSTVTAPKRAARAAERDAGALYRTARKTEDPVEAQRLFDRVAATEGPWSDVAALRSIRLDLDRGRFESALARMENAAPKLGRSPLAPEFELERIECLLRLDRHSEARRHARGFVARFPHHPRASEVRRLSARPMP